MAHARDLYKTKLCTLYQRGNCPRQSCSFAHGEAELRRFSGLGGFNDLWWQENHRSGDLRGKFERRGSPTFCRRSPSRDGRGSRQGNTAEWRFSPRNRGRSKSRSPARRRTSSRSFTPPRSPSHKRRESKKLRVESPDAHLSDVSGDHHCGDNDEHGAEGRLNSPASSPRDTLQEQLRQVQLDNEALLDEKENLEKTLGKKVEEASILTTVNVDLESKLAGSQDELRRSGSRMRKLIKLYMRCTRAQEEVKRTQSKLQTMAEEFLTEESLRPIGHVDDSDFCNLSDGLSALNVAASKDVIDDSPMMVKKKRLHSVREKTLSSILSMQQNGSIKNALEQDLEHHMMHQNLRPTMMAAIEKPNKVDMFMPIEVGPSKETHIGRDTSPQLRSPSIEKYNDDDEDADVDGVDTDMDEHVGIEPLRDSDVQGVFVES